MSASDLARAVRVRANARGHESRGRVMSIPFAQLSYDGHCAVMLPGETIGPSPTPTLEQVCRGAMGAALVELPADTVRQVMSEAQPTVDWCRTCAGSGDGVTCDHCGSAPKCGSCDGVGGHLADYPQRYVTAGGVYRFDADYVGSVLRYTGWRRAGFAMARNTRLLVIGTHQGRAGTVWLPECQTGAPGVELAAELPTTMIEMGGE